MMRRFVFMLASFFVLLARNGYTEVQTFNARSIWESCVDVIATEAFDTEPKYVTTSFLASYPGPYLDNETTPGTGDAPLFTGKVIRDFSLSLVPGQKKLATVYKLSSPANAFGFSINPQSTGRTYDIVLSFGNRSVSLRKAVPMNTAGFIGVTSDGDLFDTVTFSLDKSPDDTALTNVYYQLDNFSFGKTRIGKKDPPVK